MLAHSEWSRLQVSVRRLLAGARIDLIPGQSSIDEIENTGPGDCERYSSNFLLGPMKKGGKASMRMATVYHLVGDLISQASVYWG
jgi:hypothetical protein